jgi:hypothetical protein
MKSLRWCLALALMLVVFPIGMASCVVDPDSPGDPESVDEPENVGEAEEALCLCPANCITCGCCGPTCVNTYNDPNNCGSCGNVCAAGSTCCAGHCTNTEGDLNNCGSCGNVCGSCPFYIPHRKCQQGICVCVI